MTQNIIIIFLGIIGANLGSFLNVVAHRTIEGRSWWGKERSICENCKHELGFFELIPIFSWLILRGKCKNCGAKIGIRYILVEIIMAITFGLIGHKYGISWAGLVACVGTCGILLNSLTDIESGEIFDIYAITIGILGMLIRIAGGIDALLNGFLGGLIGFGIFALIIILSRGGMGWGDATFMAGMGALLGWKLTLLAFYIGIMFGGICVLFLMLIGKIHWGKGESVPLVPFLGVGCFITLLYGVEIMLFLGENYFFSYEALIVKFPF